MHETVYHFHRKLIADPDFADHREPVNAELRDPDSYVFCQDVGHSLHQAGHPGLITRLARCEGDNAALPDPRYLSNLRDHCYLRYIHPPGSDRIGVERRPGRRWLSIELSRP